MDLVRTRLTVDFAKIYEEKTYKGFFDCEKKTFRNEGFFCLYNGFAISLMGVLPYLSISYACYDTLKMYFTPSPSTSIENQEQGMIQNVIKYVGIGTISAIFAQVLTYPLDTIRRR